MGLTRSRLLIPGAYVTVADANNITSPWTKQPMRYINPYRTNVENRVSS